MVDGQRIHRVVGRESENVTREQAERTIETFRTKAREGRLDLPTGRKVHRTFAEAAEDYLERIEHHPKHGRNIGPKRRHIRQRLVPYFKALRADKLTDFAVSHYIKHRRDEGASTATINRELSTLSHFLNRAVEWKWLRAEQRPKIAKGQETRKRIVVLSAADQKTLMQAAIGDQDPLTWLFTAIALGTGMRHSEILRIRWSDIDPANRRIYVAKAKAGQREQPIPPGLAETLAREHDQLGKPDGYLFPTRRADATNSHRQNMSVQFRRAVIRAKLDPNKVTPHVLRSPGWSGPGWTCRRSSASAGTRPSPWYCATPTYQTSTSIRQWRIWTALFPTRLHQNYTWPLKTGIAAPLEFDRKPSVFNMVRTAGLEPARAKLKGF
jgi:integrase